MSKSKKFGKEMQFLNVLLKGRVVSRKQAASQHKLGNPSATVLRFVDAGFNIKRTYTTTSRKISGRKVPVRTVKYSIV